MNPLQSSPAFCLARGLRVGTWRLPVWAGCALALAVTLAWAAPVSAGEGQGPLGGILKSTVIFFPPLAPVFGDKIVDKTVQSTNPKLPPPPAELADYVNEHFYPALGSRLHVSGLTFGMSERLDAFRATRNTLINELADRLSALHGADDETFEAGVRALAEHQSARIRALEKEADELRRDLIEGHVLQRSVDWNKNRDWFIGVTRFRNSFMEKDAHYQVVRAAAYYQDGLLAEQRDLLLEVAIEIRGRARAALPVPQPRINDPSAMFFSPAMTRLRLPKKMSPELIEKIGRYNQEKTAIKQEIYELVVLKDPASRSERTKAFEALADRQWPRLVELERMAEEIRIALVRIPRERLAAAPYLPELLLTRIHEYQKDRQDFIDEFQRAMDAASSMARMNPEQRMAIRAQVAESFHDRTRERYEAMRKRYDAIQAELGIVAAGQVDSENGQPLTPETLLRNYTTATEKFDLFGREEVIYKGYRTAMLMPGLSPEQRRLLFGAALVGLAQPLPWSEPPPTGPLPVPRS